ncbi:MAG: hypothetical protein LBF50_08920 [Azoarcus sp.]|jgi:hypothetical protein|nr:hypothetical protein [Azoarcus sp.]
MSARKTSDPKPPVNLVVRALRQGFRRAGRAWSETGTVISTNEFTEEQLAAILAEKMLVVSSVDDETTR